MSDEAGGPRDEEAVDRFVERFALMMHETGIPRMPARVLAQLMATDTGSLTAAELARELLVSPASVSGAVRYLAQTGMVVRERLPGERRDRYTVPDHLMADLMLQRDAVLARWEEGAREGVLAVGAGTPAGRRFGEMQRFFAMMRRFLPEMLERWRAEERERAAGGAGAAPGGGRGPSDSLE